MHNNIKKHLWFLTQKFGFVKIPEYSFVREIHNDFVKDGMIIKIVYDGGVWINILKPRFEIKEIITGEKKTTDYPITKFKQYNLKNLDIDKTIWNSVNYDNLTDKSLWYFSKLLRDNNEILDGNLEKLGWSYRFMKKLGLK